MNRSITTFGVCFLGIAMSTVFTSSVGWVLLDLVEHYISNYVIIGVGLLQCIAIGWLFEADETMARSSKHARAIKVLGVLYWLPICIVGFVFSFFYPDEKIWSLIPIFLTTVMAMGVSRLVSEMKTKIWYHEVVMCGVDKLSMSITELSRGETPRSTMH